MADLILAVDIGTTVAKAVVFDLAGTAYGIARRQTPLSTPRPGWSEMDMEALWNLVCAIAREVTSGLTDRIAAISLSGISCGAWLIDRDGNPLRPAILWNDGRCAETNAAWKETGRLSEIYALSGSVIYPGFTLPLLHWLDQHEPKTLAAAAAVLCCKDWIRFQMTGEIGTDETEASYMPCDVAGRSYSQRLLELCEVPHLARILPPIADSTAIAGALTPKAASAMGLRDGIPVAHGMTDLTAATVGAGVVEPGQACTTLGTSCLNSVVMGAPDFSPEDIGISGCTVEGRWLRTVVNNAGTMNIDWAVRTFFQSLDGAIDMLVRDAAAVPVGAGGIIFHPYLSATGVVSPFVHPHAQGQFFGIREHHRRGHLFRAVLEGVAFSIRDCYAALPSPPAEVRLVGGGARNPVWCQIIADCLGIPVAVPDIEEAGAWGAAMIGAVGTGMTEGSISTMAKQIGIRRRYDANPAAHVSYSALFALYRSIAETSKGHWTAHARILCSLQQ